jgi:hypothetical protein
MTDWLKIAEARGVPGSEAERARMAAVLGALDEAFSRLVSEIPFEAEPASVFRVKPEEEA